MDAGPRSRMSATVSAPSIGSPSSRKILGLRQQRVHVVGSPVGLPSTLTPSPTHSWSRRRKVFIASARPLIVALGTMLM